MRRLRVLRELRLHATIGATARALNLTPSAISQQIAALSRDLGSPMLVPHGRGVRLTAQAQLLLEHAQTIDAQLERALADLAAMERGTVGYLTVGAFATALSGLVIPALPEFRAQYPNIRLAIEEADAPDCFTLLEHGELDVAITVDYRSGPIRSDRRYYRQELLDDSLLLAIPSSHPLARRKRLELRALAAERWIIGAAREPCQEAILAACSASGFSPDIAHRVSDWSALLHLVAAGCGVALVPRLALESVRLSGVSVRSIAGQFRPARHIYALVRAGAEGSPSIAAMLAALSSAALSRP